MAPKVVTLWLDDEHVGAGWRSFIVLSVDDKSAHLFHWPSLTRVTVPKEVLRKAYPYLPGDGWRTKLVARRLREQVEVFKRVGRDVPEETVGKALAVLEEAA